MVFETSINIWDIDRFHERAANVSQRAWEDGAVVDMYLEGPELDPVFPTVSDILSTSIAASLTVFSGDEIANTIACDNPFVSVPFGSAMYRITQDYTDITVEIALCDEQFDPADAKSLLDLALIYAPGDARCAYWDGYEFIEHGRVYRMISHGFSEAIE